MTKKERDTQRRHHRQAVMNIVKETAGCIDCGTTQGFLDFDHRPNEKKLFDPCKGVFYKWDVHWAEIAKCDVRCRPCHIKRHNRLRPKPTHCKNGHEFTPENTYYRPGSTGRTCRKCNHEANRRYRALSA